MTGFVISKTGFVLNMTRFVLNMTISIKNETKFILNMAAFVLCMTGFFLSMTGLVQKTTQNFDGEHLRHVESKVLTPVETLVSTEATNSLSPPSRQ